jgi:hypothetical protein
MISATVFGAFFEILSGNFDISSPATMQMKGGECVVEQDDRLLKSEARACKQP